MESKKLLITIALFLLQVLSLTAQTTCGTNCEQTYNALSTQANINFSTIAAGGDGFRTVCLQGDQGGFTWSSGLDFKTTSRLYICETSDGQPINISGLMQFNGAVDIHVEGTSTWSNLNDFNNNCDIFIDNDDTLEWNESGTSTIRVGNGFDLVNNGTLIINDNFKGNQTTASIVSEGDIIINGNATSISMDITMGDTSLLDINGTMNGDNNSTVTINGQLQVSGKVDQDFHLIVGDSARVEAYADWDMDHTFENNGAWIIDGDLLMAGSSSPIDFSGGYILSNSLSFMGTHNFTTSADNCGLFIVNSVLGSTSASLSVTPDTLISIVSTITVDNGNGKYDDFDILESAGFSFPTPLTDSDNSDFEESGFNNFINGKDCENHILPLSLLDFQAKRDEGQIYIHWTVAALYAFEHMILERSIDGTNFESLGSFNADYTTELTLQSYEYTDVIDAKVVYYRLVIVDRFGNSNYSYMVAVGGSEQQPITELSERTFEIVSHSSETFIIRAYTPHGQVLAQESDTRSLDLSGLAPGVYLIEISGYLVEKILLD